MKFTPLKPARINGKATKAYIKAVKEGWGSVPCEDINKKTAKKGLSAKKEKIFISQEDLEVSAKACMDYQEELSRYSNNGKVVNPNATFPPEVEK